MQGIGDVTHLAAIAMSICAALCALKAAFVHIRDNIDVRMEDMHRQGRWAVRAAVCNAVAVFLLATVAFLPG